MAPDARDRGGGTQTTAVVVRRRAGAAAPPSDAHAPKTEPCATCPYNHLRDLSLQPYDNFFFKKISRKEGAATYLRLLKKK